MQKAVLMDEAMLMQRCQDGGGVSFDTVDGSEIRRSPVEVGSLSH